MAGETKVGVPYHTGPKVTCRQIRCGTDLKFGDIVIIVMSTMGERSALLELAFMFLSWSIICEALVFRYKILLLIRIL